MTPNLGQGAWNTTCTPGCRRHAAMSLQTASHARVWASPPAWVYKCFRGGYGAPGAGSTAYHTANTRCMEASTAAAARAGPWAG